MKKHLDYIILGTSAFLSSLILILMTAPGLTMTLLGSKINASVYELINYQDTTRVGILLTLIFIILSLVISLTLIVLKILKVKLKIANIISLSGGILSLVSGILYFCSKSLVGEGSSQIISLGAGSILCGIFALLSAIALICYSILEFINK